MTITKLLRAPLLFVLFSSGSANAWFIFIPGGLIERALLKDPDSIQASTTDRSLGKCAGYHVNQAAKFKKPPRYDPGVPDDDDTPESAFHAEIADIAAERATDKDAVKDLAYAYSGAWKRVASNGIDANRSFGADLARNCTRNDLPFRLADFSAWKTHQEAKKRKQLEEEQPKKEIAAEKEAPTHQQQNWSSLTPVVNPSPAASQPTVEPPVQPPQTIDFRREAKKSAQILGCATEDVRLAGAEDNNILFNANCPLGNVLVLSCDPSGLCLKK